MSKEPPDTSPNYEERSAAIEASKRMISFTYIEAIARFPMPAI